MVKKWKRMKNSELEVLLKERGLPHKGNKDEMVERLRRFPNGYGLKGPPKRWQNSSVKSMLKKQLLDKNSPIRKMTVHEVWDSDPRYQQYPKFPKYYAALKKKVDAEQKEARLDDLKAAKHIKNNPKGKLNRRGYPHWHIHPAKKLLEVDVYKKKHETMKPCELRKTRKEYKEFPAEIFAARVNREVLKQKAANFWADKRNKQGMKKYLKEIEERAL